MPVRLLPLVLLVLTACPRGSEGTPDVPDNPDTHEPNDTAATATPVPLTNEGGVRVGSVSGYLATAGDVDRFSFEVPAGKLVYARVTAPSLSPLPPPAYLLSYELLRPDGTAEDGACVRTHVLAADLATARRVKEAGTWQVLVQACNSGTSSEPPPGDTPTSSPCTRSSARGASRR